MEGEFKCISAGEARRSTAEHWYRRAEEVIDYVYGRDAHQPTSGLTHRTSDPRATK
jgi:hypothetical protein